MYNSAPDAWLQVLFQSTAASGALRAQLLWRTSLVGWIGVLIAVAVTHAEPSDALITVTPREVEEAVLHNPDMGWVLYENYPLDQDPNGSSTLVTLPDENFDGVDAVALMFSWQDIETAPDVYDFSKVDHAYYYWKQRGKEIQLRLSATTLLWWTTRQPPAGVGAPDYVLAQLTPREKQTRQLEGLSYTVEDARNPYYRERLTKFLRAVDAHFNKSRPVSLIDLRGFGVWGEWHSGFQYATIEERRQALKTIIDTWCAALPDRRIALSYSYDPDGPKKLFAGPTDKFNPKSTTHYDEYLQYSAFDHALTKPNVAYRRDGCGGAVHSNERKFNAEAFRRGRGPMFSEFVDGYAQSKAGGREWVDWKIDDALSLHPNYINLLGYQGSDARDFLEERRDLIDQSLRRMGYRFVPTRIEYPRAVIVDQPFELQSLWVNRGVGRAVQDYRFELVLVADGNQRMLITPCGTIETSHWIAGKSYPVSVEVKLDALPPGEYDASIRLRDPSLRRTIALPLADAGPAGSYRIGRITVGPPE